MLILELTGIINSRHSEWELPSLFPHQLNPEYFLTILGISLSSRGKWIWYQQKSSSCTYWAASPDMKSAINGVTNSPSPFCHTSVSYYAQSYKLSFQLQSSLWDNNPFSFTARNGNCIAMEEQNNSVTGLTWVKETFTFQDSLAEANKLEQENRVIWEPL